MNIKKILAVVLALCFIVSIPVFSAQAEESSAAVPSFVQGEGLYAHAGTNSADTEAWMLWQNAEDEDGIQPSYISFCLRVVMMKRSISITDLKRTLISAPRPLRKNP